MTFEMTRFAVQLQMKDRAVFCSVPIEARCARAAIWVVEHMIERDFPGWRVVSASVIPTL